VLLQAQQRTLQRKLRFTKVHALRAIFAERRRGLGFRLV
jgi:hypothetical protein